MRSARAGRVHRLVAVLERDRLSLLGMALLVLGYVLVRTYTEGVLVVARDISAGGPIPYSLYNALHHIVGFCLLFAGGLFLIVRTALVPARPVANVLSLGFALVLLAPWLKALLGTTGSFDYLVPGAPINVDFGLLLQLGLILALGAGYVYAKCGSLARTLSGLVLLLLFMLSAAAVPLAFNLLLGDPGPSEGFGRPEAAAQLGYALFYLFLLFVFLAETMESRDRRLLPRLVRAVEFPRIVLVAGGFLLGAVLSGGFLSAGVPAPDDLPFLLAGALTVSAFHHAGTMLRRDRALVPLVPPGTYRQAALLLALLAAGFALALGTAAAVAAVGVLGASLLGRSRGRVAVAVALGIAAAVATGFAAVTVPTGYLVAGWLLFAPAPSMALLAWIGPGALVVAAVDRVLPRASGRRAAVEDLEKKE